MNTHALKKLLPEIVTLSKTAGHEILEFYHRPEGVTINIKKDASPVTEADISAHKIIKAGLQALTPDIPILSEEAADIPFETRKHWSTFWLVDPLDGTKEFIHRTDEFTVNIALIDNNKPILGVIYAPTLDESFYAAKECGAFKQEADQQPKPLAVRQSIPDQWVVTVSRRHGSERLKKFLEKLHDYELVMRGSSLKSCMVAQGSADIYPCLGTTSEWDTAAAHCIVEQAGGKVFDIDLAPVRYNTKESLLNPKLLVVGNCQHDWQQYL